MSTGGSAVGAYLQRTTGLPSSTAFTASGWCFYSGPGNTSFYNVFAFENSTASASQGFGLCFRPGDAKLFMLSSASYPTTYDFAKSPALGQPFFFSCVQRGTGTNDLIAYWAAEGDRELQKVTMPGLSFTSVAMWLGNNSYGDWGNFRFANVRVYGAVLSPEEILAEMNAPLPIRTTSLNSWSPLTKAANLKDYGGSGNNWTSAGTITDYYDPVLTPLMPLPFAQRIGRIFTAVAAAPSGALAGTAAITTGTSANLKGAGVLAASTAVTVGTSANLKGSGALAASTAITFGTSGALKGTGALATSTPIVVGTSAQLKGAGALLGTATATIGTSANLKGAGAVAGSTTIVFGATATPAGVGLVGTAAITFGTNSTLKGAGALAGTAIATIGTSAALKGAGAALGTATVTIGTSGVLKGVGALTGTTTVTFGATATPASSGALTCSVPIVIGTNATLTAAGKLQGTATAVFGAAGTATVSSFGTANLTFAATGTMKGAGKLAGTAAITFGAFASATQPPGTGQTAARTRAGWVAAYPPLRTPGATPPGGGSGRYP